MTFSSLQEAAAVFSKAVDDGDEELRLRSWLYLYENAPPDLKKLMDESIKAEFPTLEPDFYDEDGTPLYSTEMVCRVLGVSEEEAMERIAKYGHQGMVLAIHKDKVFKVQ